MDSNFSGKKVFVVDDTGYIRAALVKHLLEFGFSRSNILELSDGKAALEKLRSKTAVDIIFSDWNMPNMTGVQLLKAIRTSNESYQEIPFVMITTVSEKDKIIEAMKYRLNGYVLKPIQEEKLRETIFSIFDPGAINDE